MNAEARGMQGGGLRFVALIYVLASAVAGGVQNLPWEMRMNGPRVIAAFEPVREVLQESSAVIYEGRNEVVYGTVVAADGLIVTKASEIAEWPELVVRVGARKFETVRVLAIDQRWDLALLEIEAEDLVPVRWSGEGEPSQGTWVVANGTTSRSRRRALAGVISANPREVLDAGGVALGVVLDADVSKLLVNEVVEESGAAEAGVKAGDVILAFDGEEVDFREDLFELLEKRGSGERVKLRVLREEEEIELEVALTPRSELFDDPMSRNDQMSGRFSERRSGFPRVLQHDILGARDSVGGPLLNLAGECVGVNIARANRAESFAIPAKEARQVIGELRTKAGR